MEDYGFIENTYTGALVTHSKIMAWAFDRAAESIQEFGMGDEEGRKMLPHLCALRESCFSIALRNHLGRLSEECDPKLQRQISTYLRRFPTSH